MSMDRVNVLLDQVTASGRITGAVVLIYRDGEPVLERAVGYQDREAGVPVSLDTIFRYASVTKPIVAATTLAMVERGLLTLDDAVADYLPWFRPLDPDGSPADIRVRHLITHTSGLAYDASLERLPPDRAVNQGLSDTTLSLEDNFSRLSGTTLAFRPGAQWAYSTAIDVLGAVLEKVHGTPLEDAVVHHVAETLQMRDARFRVTDLSRLAVAYADSPDGPVRMPDPWYAHKPDRFEGYFSPSRIFNARAYQSGGAGMAGTARDVMRLLETIRTGGDPLFSRDLAEAGLSNQIGDVPGNPGQRFGYFGAIVTDPVAAATALPAGAIQWGGVYGNTWFILPEKGVTVVSLSNNALEGCNGAYVEELRAAVCENL
ncbi:serine hydrolase domain-containing protein [Affinirhizobium pseudoryzae]|uniref:serine hydrolase domain-containing protein n=1 Tax=Allorhizobium pseudoryzae TaxID=379684 RepID=UPI0013EC3587|nr:serine hydrolase domain-containing protein [Allorhizobium pseudoryzae]